MTSPTYLERARLFYQERLARLRNMLVYEHSEANRRIIKEEIAQLERTLKTESL